MIELALLISIGFSFYFYLKAKRLDKLKEYHLDEIYDLNEELKNLEQKDNRFSNLIDDIHLVLKTGSDIKKTNILERIEYLKEIE